MKLNSSIARFFQLRIFCTELLAIDLEYQNIRAHYCFLFFHCPCVVKLLFHAHGRSMSMLFEAEGVGKLFELLMMDR
jgi:hypothetical protein